MLKRFLSGSELSSCLSDSSCVATQTRFWVKPKKRPKVGTGFHQKANQWREEYLLDQHRKLADSFKAYMEFSSTKRTEPWDTRFKPFDRVEKDGVYIIAKHLMDDKLQLSNNHPNAVKRLFANVGLMGPQVTTVARWKSHRFAQLPASATKAERLFQKDRNLHNHGYHD